MKTFRSIKVNDIVNLSGYSTNEVAMVTFVEYINDKLRISYKTNKFQHTIIVDPNADKHHVVIDKKSWYNKFTSHIGWKYFYDNSSKSKSEYFSDKLENHKVSTRCRIGRTKHRFDYYISII